MHAASHLLAVDAVTNDAADDDAEAEELRWVAEVRPGAHRDQEEGALEREEAEEDVLDNLYTREREGDGQVRGV